MPCGPSHGLSGTPVRKSVTFQRGTRARDPSRRDVCRACCPLSSLGTERARPALQLDCRHRPVTGLRYAGTCPHHRLGEGYQ